MTARLRPSELLQVLRDKDVRVRLRAHFELHHPTSIVIDELPVKHHATRADMVVAGNETLDVYEIKSDVDNLRRFEGQRAVYESIFDSVTIVTTARHLTSVLATTPSNVGVISVDIEHPPLVQRATQSQAQPRLANILGLLTRAELQFICKLNALPARDPYRESLCWRVMRGCSPDEVRLLVRETLRNRYRMRMLKDQKPPRIWLEETSMWWAMPTAAHHRLRSDGFPPAAHLLISCEPQSDAATL